MIESVKKGFQAVLTSMDLILVLFLFTFAANLVGIFSGIQLPSDSAEPPQISPALVVFGVVFLLLTIFTQAGQLGYIRDKMKEGSAALSNFVAAGGRYYVGLLVIGLVMALFFLAVALLAALLGAAMNGSPLAGLVALILVVPIALFVFLAPFALVVDGLGPIGAIKKSFSTVMRNFPRFLGTLVILFLIGFLVAIVIGGLGALLGAALQGGMPAQVIFSLFSSFVNACLGVWMSASFMHFYLSVNNT